MNFFAIDQKMLEMINHNRIFFLDNFFIFITDTACTVPVIIILALLLASIIKKNKALRFKSFQLLTAFLINAIIINILKFWINRERPFLHDHLIQKLSSGGSPSFPSGHTGDAFVTALSIGFLFFKNKFVVYFIWLWAFVVAYTRIALGVHYPSDVLGGMLIGMIIASAVNFCYNINFNPSRSGEISLQ